MQPNDTIDDYQIYEDLGRGGFATVKRAVRKRDNMEVAIKMIDKKNMKNKKMTKRVKEEVEIHAQLEHESIIKLYCYFEDRNFVYLVLELCHNGELQNYLRRRKEPLEEDEVRKFLRQVVLGLQYLHKNTIMHRDLSLKNLLLTKDYRIKIADFGLATQLSEPEEKHTTMCGTPNFISPEIASNTPHGLESDTWSLGCMMFTLLTGKPPFDTNAIQTTINRVLHVDYNMPEYLSPEAKDLIRQFLKKIPEERPKLDLVLKHPFFTKGTANHAPPPAAAALQQHNLHHHNHHQHHYQPQQQCLTTAANAQQHLKQSISPRDSPHALPMSSNVTPLSSSSSSTSSASSVSFKPFNESIDSGRGSQRTNQFSTILSNSNNSTVNNTTNRCMSETSGYGTLQLGPDDELSQRYKYQSQHNFQQQQHQQQQHTAMQMTPYGVASSSSMASNNSSFNMNQAPQPQTTTKHSAGSMPNSNSSTSYTSSMMSSSNSSSLSNSSSNKPHQQYRSSSTTPACFNEALNQGANGGGSGGGLSSSNELTSSSSSFYSSNVNVPPPSSSTNQQQEQQQQTQQQPELYYNRFLKSASSASLNPSSSQSQPLGKITSYSPSKAQSQLMQHQHQYTSSTPAHGDMMASQQQQHYQRSSSSHLTNGMAPYHHSNGMEPVAQQPASYGQHSQQYVAVNHYSHEVNRKFTLASSSAVAMSTDSLAMKQQADLRHRSPSPSPNGPYTHKSMPPKQTHELNQAPAAPSPMQQASAMVKAPHTKTLAAIKKSKSQNKAVRSGAQSMQIENYTTLSQITPQVKLGWVLLRNTRQVSSPQVIFHIQNNKEIIVEFTRENPKTKSLETPEVMVIYLDRDLIVVYKPAGDGSKKYQTDSVEPPPFPSPRTHANYQEYTFDSLPREYWRKYLYAAKFVKMMRSSTPKITIYFPEGKFVLFDTSPDCAIEFNHCVEKLHMRADGKLTLKNSAGSGKDVELEPNNLTPDQKYMFESIIHYKNDSVTYETFFDNIAKSGRSPPYPLSIGFKSDTNHGKGNKSSRKDDSSRARDQSTSSNVFRGENNTLEDEDFDSLSYNSAKTRPASTTSMLSRQTSSGGLQPARTLKSSMSISDISGGQITANQPQMPYQNGGYSSNQAAPEMGSLTNFRPVSASAVNYHSQQQQQQQQLVYKKPFEETKMYQQYNGAHHHHHHNQPYSGTPTPIPQPTPAPTPTPVQNHLLSRQVTTPSPSPSPLSSSTNSAGSYPYSHSLSNDASQQQQQQSTTPQYYNTNAFHSQPSYLSQQQQNVSSQAYGAANSNFSLPSTSYPTSYMQTHQYQL